jgi:hypothetical protein
MPYSMPQRLAVLGALAMTVAGRGSAQPPPRLTRQAPAEVCDMRAKLIAIRVVDRRTGEPVAGATVRATRVRSREALPSAGPMGPPGDYLIVEDGAIAGLTREGEPLRVTVSKGSRRRTLTFTVALDSAGCHVELRGAPLTVRL